MKQRNLALAGGGLALLAAATTLTLGGCGGVVDDAAHATLHERLGSTSFTVFPAFLHDGRDGGHDPAAATTLAELVRAEGFGTATISTAEVPLSAKPGSNQAKMLRDNLAAFREWLAANPVDTDYAMLPEYLIDGGGRVLGIHLYVLSRDGACADAILLNSHHAPFKDANPQTPADATAVVVDVLRGMWKEGR